MDRKKYKLITIPFFRLKLSMTSVQNWSDWYHFTWLPLVSSPDVEWPEYSLHLPCLTDDGQLFGYFGLSEEEAHKVFHIKCFQETPPIKSPQVVYTIIEKIKELTEKNDKEYSKNPTKLYDEIREIILDHKELFKVCSFFKSHGRLVLPGATNA